MLLADAQIGVDSFVQYGCFGLLSALVVWSLWKGIPGILDIHRQAIERLTDSFESRDELCRQERIELAAKAAEERERDRESRHELANKFQHMLDTIERKVT